MSIKKDGKGGGYTFGNAGTKTSLSRAQARKVQKAAFANGHQARGSGRGR